MVSDKEGPGLDVRCCREATPYTRAEYLARALWWGVFPLFRFSPRPFFCWRRLLLRIFGATVSPGANIYPSATIYLPWNLTIGRDACIGEWALIYNLGPVFIGDRATVSHRAHLCAGTHDYTTPAFPLRRLPIEVGADAWICADAFIGPNVWIGRGAIVAAGAVVVKDVGEWEIVGGNPARFLKRRRLTDGQDAAEEV
ncbi:LbetaH domain-containing protein [Methylotetracoccus oryzae]|uniref:putative colanic acid biosynthesis acetyltransferase n=1 Tax=Methylotetracoccus oryzae TaxID=1919059 RepID=UPI001117CE66|nr:putative colanic acid biosynthesis acetyltransferase [Methylotetracoccus oryzae]